MVANVLMKFGRDQMKKDMGNSILKFPAPYSPVLTKMSQSTIFFLLWHITKKYWVIACIPSNYHTFHKVLLKLDENWG